MNLEARIYIAGHRGLLGSALVETLKGKGYRQLLPGLMKSLDLLFPERCGSVFLWMKTRILYHCRRACGGIQANIAFAAEFILRKYRDAGKYHSRLSIRCKNCFSMEAHVAIQRRAHSLLKKNIYLHRSFETTNQACDSQGGR